MAVGELLEPQDIMFTNFEPKMKNRFIMNIDGINAYLVKTMARPTLESEEVALDHMNVTRYVKGKLVEMDILTFIRKISHST